MFNEDVRELEKLKEENELLRGKLKYNNPVPVAVMLIPDYYRKKNESGLIVGTDGLLLIKRGNEPQKGKWALPGGFVNEKEHPRDAALREAEEETGIKLKSARLLDIFLAKNRNQIVFFYIGTYIPPKEPKLEMTPKK